MEVSKINFRTGNNRKQSKVERIKNANRLFLMKEGVTDKPYLVYNITPLHTKLNLQKIFSKLEIDLKEHNNWNRNKSQRKQS